MLERVKGVLLRTSTSDMDIYNKEPFHDFFQRIYNNSISLINMGSYTSKLQRVFSDEVPEGERFYGLENYRFTCYCNSIIQALYFCIPFRTQLLEYHSKICSTGKPKENMLTCLADLFIEIGSKKTRTGVIAPKKFIRRVRDESEHFSNFMQQDAHEFLNYLLNKLVDILEKDAKDKANSSRVQETEMRNGCPDNGISKSSTETKSDSEFSSLVHDIFQGVLTNETRCLCCETVTARDEKFLDLSLDIEENSSITSCLRKFSAVETLHSEDKFFCDKCCSLQEAQKRMKIKVLPQVLVIHLKRFKYIEEMNQFRKLCYCIAFPLELKLFNTVEDASDSETEYSLSAVVVHVGRSADRGHYITLVKSANRWVSFDDENVQIIDESVVQQCFGFARESVYNTDHGYILFYEKTIEQSPDVPDIA